MTTTPDNPLLAAALDYAGRGWRVVPLHQIDANNKCSCGNPGCESSAGKHPRPNDWQKIASAEEPQVRAWWRQWPGANVGVALGSASGVVAVDIDPPGGEAFLLNLAAGDLPETVEMFTGKGRRLIYAVPDGLEHDPKTTVFKDGKEEAVRLQSTGGQCVMPPSRHPSGRDYRWAVGRSPADLDPAPMPLWCIGAMCRPKEQPPVADAGATGLYSPGADFNRRGDWLRDVIPDAKLDAKVGDVLRVTRPGKSGGCSATIGYYRAKDGTPALYVFSGNWPGLDGGKCYDKFGAYAKLHHGGDFKAAAQRLADMNYGDKRPKARVTTRPSTDGSAEPAPPSEPEAWEAIVPLTESTSVPKFPLEAMPDGLAKYCRDVAESTGTPVDYAGVSLLGVASGLVGATLAVKLQDGTDGWRERPLLYLCVVADPSAGKTPAQSAVERPATRASQKAGGPPTFITDTTVEALAPLLKKRPRGVCLTVDEIAGWVGSFNQYKAGGKGGDRDFWLSNWTGKSWTVVRKNLAEGYSSIPHPFVSVLGGIQPDRLATLAGADDGFLERILWSYPDRLKPRTSRKAVNGTIWEEVASKLLGRAMKEVGTRNEEDKSDRSGLTECPNDLTLDAAAADVFFDVWCRRMDREAAKAAEELDRLKGVYAKMKGYAARLAVVCFALREASKIDGKGSVSVVNAEDMASGIALAEYFLDHAKRAWNAMANDGRKSLAEVALDWICRNRRTAFSRSDLHTALRRHVKDPEEWGDPLRLLKNLNWIRYQDQPRAATGRRPTPRFEVNPEAFSARELYKQRQKTPDSAQTTPQVEGVA